MATILFILKCQIFDKSQKICQFVLKGDIMNYNLKNKENIISLNNNLFIKNNIKDINKK